MPEEKKREAKMLCAYCNAPRDENMILDFNMSMHYCPTCGPDDTIHIIIKCHNCEKVLYDKRTDL